MFFFFFKQKTAYEMRISDWSSDVCSSDLRKPVALLNVDGYYDGLLSFLDHTVREAFVKTMYRDALIVERGIDRKSVVEGKSVSVRVDLGGRRIIKKKKNCII